MKKLLSLTAAACLITQAAFAHAHLQRSDPAAGATVTPAPTSLTLRFTEAVEPRFCSVTVTNAAGDHFDAGARAASDGGRILTVKLKPLPPGAYTVEWHATSVDTHRTEGLFDFAVKP